MVNYNEGKIYRIVPNCEHEPHEQYIGSTTKEYLSQRMTLHRSQYRRWKDGKTTLITSFLLFEKYGVDNCNIYLLENVDAKDKNELNSREGYFIRTLPCVNKNIPGRSKKEYRHDNRDKLKFDKNVYYQENRERLMQKARCDDLKNKEYNLEYKKKYYVDNKTALIEKTRLFREQHSSLVECPCGSKIKEYKMKDHIKSKKHQCYILNNPIPLL